MVRVWAGVSFPKARPRSLALSVVGGLGADEFGGEEADALAVFEFEAESVARFQGWGRLGVDAYSRGGDVQDAAHRGEDAVGGEPGVASAFVGVGLAGRLGAGVGAHGSVIGEV